MESIEPDDHIADFTRELLRTGCWLWETAADLTEGLLPDAYPGEEPGAVAIGMVTGTIGSALSDADPDEVERCTALFVDAREKVLEHLRLALELSRRMHGEWPTDTPLLAMDQRGNATAISPVGNIPVAFKPAGGAWRASASTGFAGAWDLALDARGDATVVRDTNTNNGRGFLVTSQFRAAGGHWRRPVTIGHGSGATYGTHLAVDARGDAVAAWVEDRPRVSCCTIRTAFKPADGPWHAQITVEPHADAVGDWRVALGKSGSATAVWTALDGVHTSSTPAGGAWSRPVRLAGPDGHNLLGSLSVGVDPRGDRLAVWGCGAGGCPSGLPSPASAATAPPHGPWHAPVMFANGDSPAAALDSHGNAVVVWVHARNAGQPNLGIPSDTVVEAATFTRAG